MTTLVVGAGYAGSVMARELADAGHRVRVIDKRPHIAGNAYDEPDAHGVLVHRYGPHIFHTNGRAHLPTTCRASPNGGPMSTACAAWSMASRTRSRSTATRSTACMAWSWTRPAPQRTSRQRARAARSGAHQRGRGAQQRRPRPVREVLPQLHAQAVGAGSFAAEGRRGRAHPGAHQYRRSLLHRHLPGHAAARLHEDVRERCSTTRTSASSWAWISRTCASNVRRDHTVYTGPIDAYFDYRFGRLPYRSLRFEHEHLPDTAQFQEVGTVNYPNDHDLHAHHRVQAPDRAGASGHLDRARIPASRGRSVLPGAARGERSRCSSDTRRWRTTKPM